MAHRDAGWSRSYPHHPVWRSCIAALGAMLKVRSGPFASEIQSRRWAIKSNTVAVITNGIPLTLQRFLLLSLGHWPHAKEADQFWPTRFIDIIMPFHPPVFSDASGVMVKPMLLRSSLPRPIGCTRYMRVVALSPRPLITYSPAAHQ
jgi:hypothetical protein